jgi:hypothetical protein
MCIPAAELRGIQNNKLPLWCLSVCLVICLVPVMAQSPTTALYRWYNSGNGDHFYTTDPTGELAPRDGYVSEGITGYIWTIAQSEGSNVATPALTNLALHNYASQSSTATDWGGNWYASKGVDGIKTGNIYEGGFHTNKEVNPWWQVDLGSRSQLTEIRIYNRLDCCSERSRTLQVLLSDEGQNWRVVYSHDGSVFGGADGKYLDIKLNNEIARFVRVQLREENWFHLDEVEVYGVPL